MNTAMRTIIRMPLRHVILFLLAAGAIIFTYLAFNTVDPQWLAFFSGISGGIIIYFISFLISIYEYTSIDRFRALGVRAVLSNRRSKQDYSKIIANAKKEVLVTGTSCTRFVDDFANELNDEHLLIDALRENNSLSVKFMFPDDAHMDPDSRLKFQNGERKLRKLLTDFPGRIEVRRYAFEPRYSFVLADKEFIVGPVFTETESQDSPAIYLDADSTFAQKYINDFKRVWDRSQPYT